ncbi:TPA: hypothetical protein ACH3X1_010806 [Trebouxia sp. C0004]
MNPHVETARSDANSAGSHGRASKAPRSAGGHVARVRQHFEAANALPSPSARATVSAPQVPAAKNAPKATGRKRKARQQPAATEAASPAASGSTQAVPPAKPSFADVVAGRTTPEQTVSALARAFGNRTYDQLQQEKQSDAEQMDLHRHSKRNNLVVFGVPESMALNTPAALARHMQGLLFQNSHKDGALIRKCARGKANKFVASAAQAARAIAPPPPRQQQAQEQHAYNGHGPFGSSAPAWH